MYIEKFVLHPKDVFWLAAYSTRTDDNERQQMKLYQEMSDKEKIEALESALIDVLDAYPDLYAVQGLTGGSVERAEEISDLHHEVENEYILRHGI